VPRLRAYGGQVTTTPEAAGGYFDAATTAPLHPAARAALLAALDDGWADPAPLYTAARRSRLLLDAARRTVADCLGVRPEEVSFCPSGTDAAQRGVLGAFAARRRIGDRLVHSAVEHSSVLHAAEHHVAAGGTASSVPVNRVGRVDAETFAAEIRRPGTAAAALMHGNHEVGTMQPVEAVGAACATAGVPLVVDAAASAGLVPLPAGWSVAALSAHKWGGPAGVGILVVRTGVRWRSPGPADEREGGRVAGALSVPAAVAAAAALRAVTTEAAETAARLRALTAKVRRTVAATVPDTTVVGDPDDRLPHVVTFSCLYVDAETLLRELDRCGIAVSSGSSCTAATLTPSHVLEAMGVLSHGNIRVSLHPETTEAEVDHLLAVLPGLVAELRRSAGVDTL